MIVSIAIPNVTIILKLVMKLSVDHIIWKTKNVMKNANGSESVAIIDSFRLTKMNTETKTRSRVMIPFLVTES